MTPDLDTVLRSAHAALAEAEQTLGVTKAWLSPPELSKIVKCDRRTIVRMIDAGSVKAERHGRCWRITWIEAERAFPYSIAQHRAAS